MNTLKNIHPGEVLFEEFLKPMKISVYQIASDLFIEPNNFQQIIDGKKSINAEIALKLSLYFGNSAKFWLGLQSDYDIEEEQKTNYNVLSKIKPAKSITQSEFA